MLVEKIADAVTWAGLKLAALGRVMAARVAPRPLNLLGDRDIEWSWIEAHIPPGPGKALDFGCGGSHLGLVAAERGYDVLAIDRGEIQWGYAHPKLRFRRCDLMDLDEKGFDLVLNCSTVEHVGLAGRYGVEHDRPDGDIEAMRKLRNAMKPGGIMLLTIPVGRDGVFPPMCRVYGIERLPRLTDGFEIVEEKYWKKEEGNRWVECLREEALDFECSMYSYFPQRNICALGGLALKNPGVISRTRNP